MNHLNRLDTLTRHNFEAFLLLTLLILSIAWSDPMLFFKPFFETPCMGRNVNTREWSRKWKSVQWLPGTIPISNAKNRAKYYLCQFWGQICEIMTFKQWEENNWMFLFKIIRYLGATLVQILFHLIYMARQWREWNLTTTYFSVIKKYQIWSIQLKQTVWGFRRIM